MNDQYSNHVLIFYTCTRTTQLSSFHHYFNTFISFKNVHNQDYDQKRKKKKDGKKRIQTNKKIHHNVTERIVPNYRKDKEEQV